jgi:hypothetical protein
LGSTPVRMDTYIYEEQSVLRDGIIQTLRNTSYSKTILPRRVILMDYKIIINTRTIMKLSSLIYNHIVIITSVKSWQLMKIVWVIHNINVDFFLKFKRKQERTRKGSGSDIFWDFSSILCRSGQLTLVSYHLPTQFIIKVIFI